jgi:NADPH2:quinone reductase
MRAAVYERPGPAAEVLVVREIPVPEPGPGEVRVRIAVSGVNPTDWRSRSGAPMAFAWQIPHQDGAGIIDAAGPGVDRSRVGQRVWVFHAARGRQYGTAAEFTCVPEAQAVPLPDEISMEQGAGLGIPYITAQWCLLADGPIDGRTVLVTGGAGAVGHAAVELAKFSGARVMATVSSDEKAAVARAAGADVVLNYRSDDYLDALKAAAPEGVDRIVDVALGANLDASLSVLRPQGMIVAYSVEDHDPTLPVRRLMVGNVLLRFMLVYGLDDAALARAVDTVAEALARGALTRLPEHEFPLDEVVAAQDAVEGGILGKVLVRP